MEPLVITDVHSAVPPVGRKLVAMHRVLETAGARCELELSDGRIFRCGKEPPQFRLVFRTTSPLRRGFDLMSLGEAYIEGEYDIEGDMAAAMDLRYRLSDKRRLWQILAFWWGLLFRPLSWRHRQTVDYHYSFGDDFYLYFLDRSHRFYTHGHFHTPDESLERASENKMKTIWEKLELEPGKRLLDIGGGWGGVPEYCGARGVDVTVLTLAQDSRSFIQNLIDRQKLTARVHLQDFLEHEPEEPYDAITILGVIEHIPNYRRFAEQVWACLKPGGLLYLDASAAQVKYHASAFTVRYIWPGTHSFLCVQDLSQELLFHGMELMEVVNETKDYEHTMRHWAERLDANRAQIAAKWDERLFRIFQLYLWGGNRALAWNDMQGYRVVARRSNAPGPRPSRWYRFKNAVKAIF